MNLQMLVDELNSNADCKYADMVSKTASELDLTTNDLILTALQCKL